MSERDAACQIAQASAWRGDRERAFAWLERAYRHCDAAAPGQKPTRCWQPCTTPPRVEALVRQMKLPQ